MKSDELPGRSGRRRGRRPQFPTAIFPVLPDSKAVPKDERADSIRKSPAAHRVGRRRRRSTEIDPNQHPSGVPGAMQPRLLALAPLPILSFVDAFRVRSCQWRSGACCHATRRCAAIFRRVDCRQGDARPADGRAARHGSPYGFDRHKGYATSGSPRRRGTLRLLRGAPPIVRPSTLLIPGLCRPKGPPLLH